MYSDSIEGLTYIKFSKDLSLRYSGYRLFYQGDKIFTLLRNVVKLPEINTEA